MTPAITGPECSPTRIVNGTGSRDRNRAVAATMSSANFRRHPGVIGARRRQAVDRHVAVADRLYLFDPDIFGELVEFAEQFIETGNYFIDLHARRDLAEADDVGKNNGGVIEMIRDVAFPVAKPCHDLGR